MKSETIKLPVDIVELIKNIEPKGVNLTTSTWGRGTAIRNLNDIIQKGTIEVPVPERLFMYKGGVGIELEFEDEPRKVRNVFVRKENYGTLKGIFLSNGYKEKSERCFQKGTSTWYAFPVDIL